MNQATEVYLSPAGLPEVDRGLFSVRSDAGTLALLMPDNLTFALMGFVSVLLGGAAAFIGLGGLLQGGFLNWPSDMMAILVGAVFVALGVPLLLRTADYRVIIVGPGRATVAWTILRIVVVRSVTMDVRRIVVQHDIWSDRVGSTDRVILEGQDRVQRVLAVSNVPPAGTFKLYNGWRVGSASEFVPDVGVSSERGASPVILGLARALAEATAAPLVLRVGTARGPSIAIGSD